MSALSAPADECGKGEKRGKKINVLPATQGNTQAGKKRKTKKKEKKEGGGGASVKTPLSPLGQGKKEIWKREEKS